MSQPILAASTCRPGASSPNRDFSAATASGSFRERIGTARKDDERRSSGAKGRAARGPSAGHDEPHRTRDARTSPWLPRPDGTLCLGAIVSPPLPAAGPRVRPAQGSAVLTSASTATLCNVRVGGDPGASRVHATVAEGRHAGVELRAVERNGRVSVELIAPSGAAERALRAEMPALRQALIERGLDGASLTLDLRGGNDRPRDGSDRAQDPSAVDRPLAPAPRSDPIATMPVSEMQAGDVLL